MLANKARLIAHQFLLQYKTQNFNSLIVNFDELSEQLENLLNSNEVKTLHQVEFIPEAFDGLVTANTRRATPAEFLFQVFTDAITLGHRDMMFNSTSPDELRQAIVKQQAYYHGAHGEWEDHGHNATYAHSQRHTLNLLSHYSDHVFYAIKLGLFN